MKKEDGVILALIILAVAVTVFKKVGNIDISAEQIKSKQTEINLCIDKAEEKVLKEKDDEKDDEKDENECPCDGGGYIIHGDGHKTPCPCEGDCKCKEKTTAFTEEKNGIINFYTLPNCAPCLKWKKEIKPWLEASDWKVEELPSTKAAPWFEIWIDNQMYTYQGFMSKQAFKEIFKNAKEK